MYFEETNKIKRHERKQNITNENKIDSIKERIKSHATEYVKEDVPLFMQISLQNPHLPLELPDGFSGYRCNIIHDSTRKEYCKSVQMLDFAVGTIVTSLMKYHLWEDTLFVFTSDNGAVVPNSCSNGDVSAGTNYPYRGEKGQVFEGLVVI